MAVSFPFSFPPSIEEIRRRRAIILSELFAIDEGFCSMPVSALHPHTLRTALERYDHLFFSGYLALAYGQIDVTLSSRLTSSAGKFIYMRNPSMRFERVEIRMSSYFLFRLSEGPFNLNGLTVSTPQEAFLIVFEHELCHALEAALYGKTGHSKRFLSLANGLFSHTTTTHNLPTRKQAAARNGLSVGMQASFPYDGKQLRGLITYIGKTATVMVPSPHGAYRDKTGRRYTKYRVPQEQLQSL